MAVDKNVNVTFTGKDELSPIGKKISQVLGNELTQNIMAVGKAAVVMNQAFELSAKVMGSVVNSMSSVIDAANTQENAVNRLNSSLMQMGEFSAETSIELQNYASSLQNATKFGDEAIINQIAFAQAMGANVQQSKSVVAAAADMSAALGMDFNSAVRNLSKTLGGLPGELGEVLPELKALSKEQLQAGKGIELLARKYSGFAQRDVKTFSGALAQSKNAFGDLLEQVGFVITKNELVIKGINSATKVFKGWADSLSEIDMASVAQDVETFATALGLAAGVVGTYIVIANGAAIATAAWATASTALAGAMAIITSPITLTIAAVAALTAGIFFLIKNVNLVVGALKVGLAFALQGVTLGIKVLLKGLSLAVGVFNKDWASSIDGAVTKIDEMIEGLKSSGRAQMAAAKAAKENSKSNVEIATTSEAAAQKIQSQEQALVKLNVQYAKSVGAAESAFAAAREFSPQLKLEKFMEEQKAFEKALQELQEKGNSLKIELATKGDDAAIKDQIKSIEDQQKRAAEALKALSIRNQQAIREARIKEVELEVSAQKQKVFSTEQEIKQIRLNTASEIRDQLIQIETQRLLEQRGLLEVNAQAGISIKTEAALQANQIELEAFRNKLNAEKEMALSVEQQKQLEIANLRASLLEGTSGAGQAGQDVEVLKEQQKLAQLSALRQQGLLSEQQYQMDRNAIVQAGKQAQFDLEMQMEQQRISALGLSPEALQAKLDMQVEKDAMELQNLRVKLQNKQLTEEEFRIANAQLEANSGMAANQIKQQHLQQEIQMNRAKGESFKATLKEIELAQQQHGQVMGTLRAVQGSAEYGAINGMLGNLSSLRNSESKKEFEIGKKAAIAQTLVNTFMSATMAFSALAGIPIVGPALGAAAAAAAVASGMMNLRQIKKQKFGGGGSAGGEGSAPSAPVPSASLGGQADQGMDAVPRSLSGKSFILSAGERVVQPEANRDLTSFLKEANNAEVGGTTVNITVQGNISSQADARIIADAVVAEIRARSERGQPIINSKGIVNG